MTTLDLPLRLPALRPATLLKWSGRTWFTAAAIGQVGFIVFILVFYGSRILPSDWASWNDKPLITGHQAGDTAGNSMFALHMIFAAVMTAAGLIQLIPQIRAKWPALHRASGRTFLVTACVLSVGGLWLTWVRGTYLSTISAIAITGDAILILVAAFYTIRHAVRREIAAHQRWAMRLFLVANGVWFLRVGMMAWIILAQGPVGLDNALSGPMDIVLIFGCYLIPLAVYEIYAHAGRSRARAVKYAAAGLVFTCAAITALGVVGTVAFMWGPYL